MSFREPTIQYQEITEPVRFSIPAAPAFLDMEIPGPVRKPKVHASRVPAFSFRNYIEGFPVVPRDWDSGGGNYPDRIIRKRVHPSNIPSDKNVFAVPQWAVPPESWNAVFPDRITRPKIHSSTIPSDFRGVFPIVAPVPDYGWPGYEPDRIYRNRAKPWMYPFTALQRDIPVVVPTFFKTELPNPFTRRKKPWIHPALIPSEFLIPYFTDIPIPFDANRKLLAIVDLSETWTSHFATRGWATIADQIAAGYPLYCHPTLTSGSYEEVYDIGAVLEGTVITLSWSIIPGSGTITIVPKLAISLDNVTFTPFNVGTTLFAEAVRYIKFRFEYSAVGDKNCALYHTITLNMSTKREMDGGTVDVFAADSGGTTVLFNKAYKDVETITVTPLSTVEQVAIYDFVDVPNPTQFKILLYNTAGARIDGTVSWKSRGIV